MLENMCEGVDVNESGVMVGEADGELVEGIPVGELLVFNDGLLLGFNDGLLLGLKLGKALGSENG